MINRLREECAQEEARLMTREEKMGATKDRALIVHTSKNFNKRRRRTFITIRIRERNKRRPREILPMFDAILVMKRDTLQEIEP